VEALGLGKVDQRGTHRDRDPNDLALTWKPACRSQEAARAPQGWAPQKSARALRGRQTGNVQAVAKIKERVAQRAIGLHGLIEGIKRTGVTSVRAIAHELNQQGVSAPGGGL
jgi:hypothetical protein